jgi:hypothetical protein
MFDSVDRISPDNVEKTYESSRLVDHLWNFVAN